MLLTLSSFGAVSRNGTTPQHLSHHDSIPSTCPRTCMVSIQWSTAGWNYERDWCRDVIHRPAPLWTVPFDAVPRSLGEKEHSLIRPLHPHISLFGPRVTPSIDFLADVRLYLSFLARLRLSSPACCLSFRKLSDCRRIYVGAFGEFVPYCTRKSIRAGLQLFPSPRNSWNPPDVLLKFLIPTAAMPLGETVVVDLSNSTCSIRESQVCRCFLGSWSSSIWLFTAWMAKLSHPGNDVIRRVAGAEGTLVPMGFPWRIEKRVEF